MMAGAADGVAGGRKGETEDKDRDKGAAVNAEAAAAAAAAADLRFLSGCRLDKEEGRGLPCSLTVILNGIDGSAHIIN